MMRQSTPVLRGTVVVLCISIAVSPTPLNAWTTGSLIKHPSSQRTAQSRLFLKPATGDSSSNPNPTSKRTRARRLNNDRARATLDMTMASTSSASITSAKRENQQARRGRRRRQRYELSADKQRRELVNHELLTREEEFDLGSKVVQANKLRASMAALVEEKKESLEQEILKKLYTDALAEEELLGVNDLTLFSGETIAEDALFDPNGEPVPSGDELFLQNHYQNQRELGSSDLDELDDGLLTDKDIVDKLELPGGRAELQRTLLEGAFARDRLIRNNIRLVVSISKQWAKQRAKYDGSLTTTYDGSEFRPSLDEVTQEGLLGLVTAADRYDPSRGFRFSTYATSWITDYVRRCFQRAYTGCLHVPYDYHKIKQKYTALLNKYNELKKEVPPEEDVARELGVSVYRLTNALRWVRPLVLTDGPRYDLNRGSGAGGDVAANGGVTIADFLECTGAQAEDQVELSFLRQCLENAMASQLTPFERDVLRLRLGLDDGVSRTSVEVAKLLGGCISARVVRSAESGAYKKLREPCTLQQYDFVSFFEFVGLETDRQF